MGKQGTSLVEPELLRGQGIDQIVCEHFALELVKTSRGLETNASGGQVIVNSSEAHPSRPW
jgi:hypothetical protein